MNISSLPDQNVPLRFETMQSICDEKTQYKTNKIFSREVRRAWTRDEEEILRQAVEKCKRGDFRIPGYFGPTKDSRCHLFFTVSKCPEVKQLGRNLHQLRDKWIRDLSPDSLGGFIQENHRKIIEKLCKKNPNKWAAVSKEFSEMELPDKPLGKYYSDNTIKNYFYSKNKRVRVSPAQDSSPELNQKEKEDSRSSSITSIEATEFPDESVFEEAQSCQDKVERALSRTFRKPWNRNEEQTLKKTIEKYAKEHPNIKAYCGPSSDLEWREVFSTINEYPEIKRLNRTQIQLRNKWTRDLCRNSLGVTIQEKHKTIIEKLQRDNPNQWGKISAIFSEMELPGKPSGKYYANITIQNYFYVNKRRVQVLLAQDSNPELNQKEDIRSSSTTSIEATEFPDESAFEEAQRCQDKVERVFFRTLLRNWNRDEEETLKKTIEKYAKEHPDIKAYCGPSSDQQWREVFSAVNKYPQIKRLNRTQIQLRNKWARDLCPNSLGATIQETHKTIIEQLQKDNPNQWGKISAIFSEMELPGKPSGKYYTNIAIQNYFYVKNRGIQRKLAKDLNRESVQAKEEESSMLDESMDFPFEGLFDDGESSFLDDMIRTMTPVPLDSL